MAEEEYYDEEFEDDDFLDGSGPEASDESVCSLQRLLRCFCGSTQLMSICSHTRHSNDQKTEEWMLGRASIARRVSSYCLIELAFAPPLLRKLPHATTVSRLSLR